jgi:hypothetical protein
VWRRVVVGVAVAGAVGALALAVGEPESRVAGIVVPQLETGEPSAPQVTVRAAAAEPTRTSSAPVSSQTVPPSTVGPVTTSRPTAKPPAASTGPAGAPAATGTVTVTGTAGAPTATRPGAPRFDPSGTFRIVNYVNSLVLDSGGWVQPGSAMKLWEPMSTSTNLRFQLIETGGGYYRLVNRTNGLTVDGRGATNAGASVGQGWWNSSAAMQWMPTDVGRGLFTLTNRATGMELDGGGPGVQYGAPAKQWPADGSPNHFWRIETV